MAPQQNYASQLRAALRAALDGSGPAGVLLVGPSGSGKTGLVLQCIAETGARAQYGNALTERDRAYFAAMEPTGAVFDGFFLAPASSAAAGGDFGAETVLVVDDLDALADDARHGLDGLLKLLPPALARKGAAAADRRVCVCIATVLHTSNKRMLDLYRRCATVRVPAETTPQAAATGAPKGDVAAGALYRLTHALLSGKLPRSAAAGISEPDRVTVGLLLHENAPSVVPTSLSPTTAPFGAALAHDFATADAISTLPHQAQSWHLSELTFLLRTFRPNHRMFGRGGATKGGFAPGAPPPPLRFTKLLTRCSTESGTRAFLADQCLRQGCSWPALRRRLRCAETLLPRMDDRVLRLAAATPRGAAASSAAEVRRLYRCLHAETSGGALSAPPEGDEAEEEAREEEEPQEEEQQDPE